MKRKSVLHIFIALLILTVSFMSFTACASNASETDSTDKYSLTLNSSGGGTVSGEGSYIYNTSVTVKATANSGYVFNGWYNGSTLKSNNATYTFTMPKQNFTLTAVFSKQGSSATDIEIYYNNNFFDYTKYYLELYVGDKAQFTAKILPANATTKTVTWSSDSSAVIVTQSGLVYAKSAGTAYIKVTADDITISIKIVIVIPEITLTSSNYKNYLNVSYSLNNNTASVSVTAKYGYKIQSLDMNVSIPIEIVYSSSKNLVNKSVYTTIFIPVGINGYTSYPLYNIISANTPLQSNLTGFYTFKFINYSTPLVSVSGSVTDILYSI